MSYDIKKKIFWKGPKPHKTTMSFTANMFTGLTQLSEVTGTSVPDLVCEALEPFLIEMVKQGLIPAPKGEEDSFKDLVK